MSYSPLYKTSKDNGLIAHVYEHLLAQYVLKYLQDKGFFILSDIILTAKTYGDTCYMDVELYNQAAPNAYNEALQAFDKHTIPEKAVRRAVSECGIEMNRAVLELKQDELISNLSRMQSSDWRQQSEMTYRKSYDKSSVNTLFCVPYLKYGKKSKKLFPEYVLEYSIDEEYINSPIDQALAAIVMQTVALNFLVAVRENYTVYDRGDQWSEASLSVGYRMFLGLAKEDKQITNQLKHEFTAYIQYLLKSPFCSNLQKALLRCSRNLEQVLLGRSTLNNILGGCVIGGRGWLEMADDARIKQMIAAIQLDVYDI